MRKCPRIVSLILIFALLFTTIPVADFREAFAFDPNDFTVTKVTIRKDFDSAQVQTGMHITITGKNLSGAKVLAISSGIPIDLGKPAIDSDGVLYFEFKTSSQWEKLKDITGIMVEGKEIPLGNKGQVPTITSVTPKVKAEEDTLVIKGADFKLLVDYDSEFVVKYGRGVSYKEIDKSLFDVVNNVANIDKPSGELGLQDINIERRFATAEVEFGGNKNPVDIEILYVYNGQFRLIKDLDISSDIEMYPNRGIPGSRVYFTGTTLGDYDVYFLKDVDGIDTYKTTNRGQNPTYQPGKIVSGTKEPDILTVEVPNISAGEYFVVLTNKVGSGNPAELVTRERVHSEKFTVIQGARSATIDTVQPNQGPDSGSRVTITGRYLGSLNIDDLKLGSYKVNLIETDEGELKIDYTELNDSTYRNANVTALVKKVKVIIGNQARVLATSQFSPDIDRLEVEIPPIDIGNEPVKDVVVEMETEIKTENNTYVFTERAELPKGYTFIPSRIKPEVQSVVPEEIHVVRKDGTYDEYIIPQDLMIGIYGKNFAVTRFIYNEETRVSYPIIRFGNVEINKNQQPDIELYVMDDSGNIIDGTPGNELGSKILVIIPEGTKIPKEYVDTNVSVVVTNPVRNSLSPGLPSEEQVMVKFTLAKEGKIPVISSVTPNVVTVDGGETVTISGSNFLPDVKVFIDGREVSGVTRAGDGKTLTFKAPPGREGTTQLQVMNPDGGIAIREFNYVKTYTNPKIADFSPKAGNTGTLVLVKGDNFLPPDPTSTAQTTSEIYKLVGTRILLQNRDINDYNVNPNTQRIELQYYASPENNEILRIGTADDGRQYLQMADYWHSVVFTDGLGKFYTLRQDAQGSPILTDGVKNTYRLNVKHDGGEFKIFASKEGASDYLVEVKTDNETIGGKEIKVTTLTIHEPDEVKLYMQTLYKVDNNGIIVGNNVKVIDKNTIIFRVPILTLGDGYYDLTVLNPDTKRDSRTGTQGFYYYTLPQSKPEIHKIFPDKGSIDGGYTIDIIGNDFKDDGTYKSKVFINGVQVKAEDTFVSVDGKTITVKVPPFTGDLSKEKETDRITVPVVVLNPDGASASKEDGFTYMVPTSYPEITKIVPAQGSAAGKEIVEIIGKDFRYFEPYSDDNRNQTRDDSETYNDLNGNGEWDDFRNKSIEELKEEYDDNFESMVSPILPKVYFGNKVAEIIEFDDGYLKVKTPAGSAGTVDVYVVNNDSGISNKVKYTYTATNPAITRIVPPEGKKQGGDRVEIFGSNFVESEIKILNKDKVLETLPMVQVRFGNVTNRDIPREEENSGRIDNQRTTVNLPGGLRVQYENGRIHLQILEGGITYVTIIEPTIFDGSPLFVSTRLLKDGDNPYPHDELIRLEISDRRLYVERGYAPKVEFLNSGQLVVTTPAYYTIGPVDVFVINPDGGTAKGQFTYKYPDSKPYITNITKDGQSPEIVEINGREVKVLYMTYKGGNTVSIIGGDFRENARIQISDVASIEPRDITYMLPTKLTFKMPAVPEDAVGKLHRVVVINEDGGSAASDEAVPLPIYIMFIKGETAPAITRLVPAKGPTSGGTRVRIEGKDFREGLKVFFGEIPLPQENVQVVDYKTILVITPPHPPGSVEVKVENPDGELSNPSGIFTYISSPKVAAVVDPDDPTETTRITRISVEGGQRIKIKGTSFMPGARVVFAPTIKRIDSEEDVSGNVVYIDGEPYLLEEGTEAREVVFIDSETLTVVTPPGKLDSKGIIVINPDGGASDIYDQIVYGLPELEAPGNVVAELIYDRYIKITWSPVEGAEGYEIFAIIDDNEMDFIGTTNLTAFVFSDLEPNTRYSFVVKALGRFGSSPPSARSNTVKTGRQVGPPDDDGELVEETVKERVGDTVRVIIGTEDYRKDTTVDLNDISFAGAKKVVITLPAEVITRSNAGDIKIIGKDFDLKFNPSVFDTSRVRQYRNSSDAGVRFELAVASGNLNSQGRTLLSTQYVMNAGFYVGKDVTVIDFLSGYMEFTLEYDRAKADLRKITDIALYRYNEANGDWQQIFARYNSYDTVIRTTINRLGTYAILGARR